MGILLKRKSTAAKVVTPVVPKTSVKKLVPDPVLNAIHQKYYSKKSRKEKKNMAVKEKVATIAKVAKEKKGKTIDDLWVDILSAAVGKRLTDTALAVQMSEAATKLTGKPRKYDEASVAGHRSGYNCGKFPIQKGVKPAVRLEKFEAPKVTK